MKLVWWKGRTLGAAFPALCLAIAACSPQAQTAKTAVAAKEAPKAPAVKLLSEWEMPAKGETEAPAAYVARLLDRYPQAEWDNGLAGFKFAALASSNGTTNFRRIEDTYFGRPEADKQAAQEEVSAFWNGIGPAFEARLFQKGDLRLLSVSGGWCSDEQRAKSTLELLRKAVAEKKPFALYEYGNLTLYGGCGVPRDQAQGQALIKEAAEKGYLPAIMGRARLLLPDPREEAPPTIPKDEKAGLALLQQAAAAGYPPAQVALAAAGFEGKWGQAADDAKAAAVFLSYVPKAPAYVSWGVLYEQEISDAYAYLGLLTERGRGGVTANADEAIRLYRTAEFLLFGASRKSAARPHLDRLGVDYLFPEDRAKRGPDLDSQP